jgi:gliding motility-associated-like protein
MSILLHFTKIIFSFLMLIFLLLPQQAQASHVMGADIAWQCISPGKYKVVYKGYRDCRGAPFLGQINIPSIRCVKNSQSRTFTTTRTSIRDITPTCTAAPGACSPSNTGNTGDGVEEHTWEFDMDFTTGWLKDMVDDGCCEFEIIAQECCVNGAINTVSGGTFYTSSMINICNIAKTKTKCDNGPIMSNPPVAYICCNQPFYFNNGASDVQDGDSLVFSMGTVQRGSGVNANYLKGLSPTWPMTSYCRPPNTTGRCVPRPNRKPPEGFYYDTETGDLVWMPTDCDETGVLVIQIDQWRLDSTGKTWVKLSYSRREIQVRVIVCGNNNSPQLNALQLDAICEGEKICVDIEALDEEFNGSGGRQPWVDTIDLDWTKTLPGATFEVDSPKLINDNGVIFARRVAKLCWQTRIGDGREAPYPFVVTARDRACPKNAISSRGYAIRVKRKAFADREYTKKKCGLLVFESIPEDTFFYKGTYQHDWAIRDSTNAGNPLYRSFNKKDSFRFAAGGKYIITYTVNNPPLNCPTEYFDTIIMPPQLQVFLPSDTFVCQGDSMRLDARVENGTPAFSYKWFRPLGNHNPKDTLLSYKWKPEETQVVEIKVFDTEGCEAQDSTIVNFIYNPVPYIGPDVRICSYDTLFLESNYPRDSIWSFKWFPSPLNRDTSHSIWWNQPGMIYHTITDTLGCTGTDSMELFVNEKVISLPGPNRGVCIFDTIQFDANRSPIEYEGTYQWTNITTSTFISNDSSILQNWNDTQSRRYELYVTVTEEGVTCVDADTFRLTVWPLPVLQFTPMNPKCSDYGAINLNSADGPKAIPAQMHFYSNKENVITGGRHPAAYFFQTDSFPAGVSNYKIYADFTDSNGCYNQDSIYQTIHPNPIVELDTGYYCQNYLNGELPLRFMVKRVTLGADIQWKVLSAPSGAGLPDPNVLIINKGTQINPDYVFDMGLNRPNRTGIYTVSLCATNILTGCSGCDTSIIEVVELPVIEFEAIPNQCVNYDTLRLDDYVNLSKGKWMIIEKDGSTDPSMRDWLAADSVSFMPFKGPGLFSLRYLHTASGCPVEDTTELNVSSLPQIRLDTFSRICSSADPRLMRSIIPANPGVNGTWEGFGLTGSFNNTFLDPSQSPKNNQYEGPYTYKFSFQNPLTKCINSDTFRVTIQSQPEVSITHNKPYEQCEFIPFDLQATQRFANSTTWQTDGDGTLSDAKILSPVYTHGTNDTTIGQVWVKISTDPLGVCPVASDSGLLLIRPYPQIDFVGGPLQGCQPLVVDFQSQVFKPTDGDVSYDWVLDTVDIRTAQDANPSGINYPKAGDYNIKLKVTNNKGGCVTEIEKENYVNVHPVPVAAFETDPGYFTTIALTRFRTQNLSRIQFGEMSYAWDWGTGNPEDTSQQKDPVFFYPQDTAEYIIKLVVTSDKDCQDSAFKRVKIGPDVTVFIPNAFTPNQSGPGLNNRFYVVADGIISFNIRIYNRWGEQMYISDDLKEGWDGKFQGDDCQQDVYMYVVNVKGFDGKLYEYSGTISLLR